MHDHENVRGAREGNGPASARKAASDSPAPLRRLLGLQSTVGNAAVVRTLQRSTVQDVLRTGGRPMDSETRGDMEARLGADLSDVRIHDDATARASAAEIGARAYTSGSHVVIGDGGHDRHTLAHELTHVIQQRQGPVAGTDNGAGLKVSDPSDRFEREAEANATRVMSEAVRRQPPASAPSPVADGEAAGVQAPHTATVQRAIKVTLDGYAQANGVADGKALAREQVQEYFSVAVSDDYLMALSYAQDGGDELKRIFRSLRGVKNTPGANGAVELQALVAEIRDTMASIPSNFQENNRTRYAVEPVGGYKNSRLPGGMEGVWKNDEAMWEAFGRGLGEHARDAKETAGRSRVEPIKQLTWEQAKRLLPRPLVNLIFDVRFQLESGSRVDERTPGQLAKKDDTPNEPGTLRSWHQDDAGRLPATGVSHSQGEAGFRSLLPQQSRNLHDHYRDNSQSGSGSSIRNAAAFPRGLAEYTGTGSNYEHMTKVVLDYASKKPRVYLTLTHYQFWGLVEANGRTYFVPSSTQNVSEAGGKIEAKMQELNIPAGATYRLMSPWLEIQVVRSED